MEIGHLASGENQGMGFRTGGLMTIWRSSDSETKPMSLAETKRLSQNLSAKPISSVTASKLTALFRMLFGLSLLFAFIPTLPTIARSLGWMAPPTFRTVDCAAAGLKIEEMPDGKRSIYLRSCGLGQEVYRFDNPFHSDFWLLEDGIPMHRHVFVDQFAELPGGFRHVGNQLQFRPSLAASTSELPPYSVRIPQYCELERQLRSPWLQGLADAAVVLLLLAGSVTLAILAVFTPRLLSEVLTVGATGARVALVAVVVLRLSLAMVAEWNYVALTPDSNSFIKNHATRTPLYPQLLDYLASEESVAPWEYSDDPSHPLLTAIRAVKLFWLASVAFFVWSLTRVAAPYLIALVVGWVAVCDIHAPWQSQWQMLNYVMSEPLNNGLTFVHLGLLVHYVIRPRWHCGLAAAIVAALLMLSRPQNLPLFLSFAVMALADQQVGGWRLAFRRIATLVLVAGLFLPTQYAFSIRKGGDGIVPPLTGHCLTGFAMQFASSDDIPHIHDPKMREVLRICIEENGWRRLDKYSPDNRSMDVNIYEVAVPSLRAVYGKDVSDVTADHVLSVIAKTIISRRPLEYVLLVHANAKMYWQPWIHVPLLATIAVSAWTFARTRERRFLITLLLGILPFLFAAIYCIFARPHGRYSSQFAFAGYMAPPLLLAFMLDRSKMESPIGAMELWSSLRWFRTERSRVAATNELSMG